MSARDHHQVNQSGSLKCGAWFDVLKADSANETLGQFSMSERLWKQIWARCLQGLRKFCDSFQQKWRWTNCTENNQNQEDSHPVRVLQGEDQCGFHLECCYNLLAIPFCPVIRILSSVMMNLHVSLNHNFSKRFHADMHAEVLGIWLKPLFNQWSKV